MSLAVVYFSVVFLINLISVPKIELCFIFVGGRSWGIELFLRTFSVAIFGLFPIKSTS